MRANGPERTELPFNRVPRFSHGGDGEMEVSYFSVLASILELVSYQLFV